jgi:hypothetical protein
LTAENNFFQFDVPRLFARRVARNPCRSSEHLTSLCDHGLAQNICRAHDSVSSEAASKTTFFAMMPEAAQ